MPYTYMLRCADDSLYVGSTVDLETRLAQHSVGTASAYTRRRLPVVLIWSEEHQRVDDAFRREKQIQNWSRAKRLALARGDTAALRAAARSSRDSASAAVR